MTAIVTFDQTVPALTSRLTLESAGNILALKTALESSGAIRPSTLAGGRITVDAATGGSPTGRAVAYNNSDNTTRYTPVVWDTHTNAEFGYWNTNSVTVNALVYPIASIFTFSRATLASLDFAVAAVWIASANGGILLARSSHITAGPTVKYQVCGSDSTESAGILKISTGAGSIIRNFAAGDQIAVNVLTSQLLTGSTVGGAVGVSACVYGGMSTENIETFIDITNLN